MSYYPIPPAGYMPTYDYSTSTSVSPSPEDYDYYHRLRSPGVSPGRAPTKSPHARTPSYTTSPRVAGWSPAGYPSPGYYSAMPNYAAPPAKTGYVSTKESHSKAHVRRYSVSGGGKIYVDDRSRRYESTPRSRKQDIFLGVPDEAHDRYREPVYTYVEPRTAPATKTAFTAKKSSPARKADNYFFFSQTTSYEADTPTRSRVRRGSTSAARKSGVPLKPAKVQEVPAAAATAADAARHNIPAGYALKNWDPTEEPILLLGSVFDANSLGKWIYDWTVYHHKAASPLTEVAGELWLLLIKFAGKMKRAEECLGRVRGHDRRETVSDFLASGDRVWAKLKSLLKACEEYMWKAAKKDKDGNRVKVQMGEKSGIEFVKSIFGRERELEKTEQLMTSVRLWNMRFDANCEEILRHPSKGN